MLAPLFLLSYSLNTYALSASTANTIQGKSPYIVLNGTINLPTTDDLLTVSYKSNMSALTPTNPSIVVSSSDNPKASDFGVLGLVDYYDPDGDSPISATKQGITGYSYTFKDASGAAVAATDLLTAAKSPYTLSVTLSALNAQSTYGDPLNGTALAAIPTQNYKITVFGLRYIETPLSDFTAGGITNGTGGKPYYVAGEGFDYAVLSASSKSFPSTAFPNAKFKPVTSSDNDYTEIYENGTLIIDDKSGLVNSTYFDIDSSGYISFTSTRPPTTSTFTVKKIDKDDANKNEQYNFSIGTGKWAAPFSTNNYYASTANATATCGGNAGLFYYTDLSSGGTPTAPGNNVLGGPMGTQMKRGIGKFGDEWGDLSQYTGMPTATWTQSSPNTTTLTGMAESGHVPGERFYNRIVYWFAAGAYSYRIGSNNIGGGNNNYFLTAAGILCKK